ETQETSEGKIRIPGFADRWHIRNGRCAFRISDGEQLDFARLHGSEYRSQWHYGDIDAAFRQIRNRVDGAVVCDEGRLESGALLERQIGKVGRAWRGKEIELRRLFARQVDEVSERADRQGPACGDRQIVLDGERDWLNVAYGCVGDLRSQQRHDREGAVSR